MTPPNSNKNSLSSALSGLGDNLLIAVTNHQLFGSDYQLIFN